MSFRLVEDSMLVSAAENSNRDMKRRGSTGCWQADSLTWQEENAYKANMGHFPGYTVE
jgi:hypothetical protein